MKTKRVRTAAEQRETGYIVETVLRLVAMASTHNGTAYRDAIDELHRMAQRESASDRAILLEFAGALCVAADDADAPGEEEVS